MSSKTPLSHRLAQFGVILAQLEIYLGVTTFAALILAHYSAMSLIYIVAMSMLLCFMVSVVILILDTVLALVFALLTGTWGTTVQILLEETQR